MPHASVLGNVHRCISRDINVLQMDKGQPGSLPSFPFFVYDYAIKEVGDVPFFHSLRRLSPSRLDMEHRRGKKSLGNSRRASSVGLSKKNQLLSFYMSS